MQRTLFAFGVNHETASLAASEVFALSRDDLKEIYEAAADELSSELLLLSTCNRTEAYLYGSRDDVDRVRALVGRAAGRDWPEADFLKKDEPAVRHVLQVASGMRSLVLGDGQILAQMKEAYRRAVTHEAVDMVLHRLLHTAFRAAKRVAGETHLGSGAASVPTAAVAMADAYFEEQVRDGRDGARTLVVGAGQMGQLVLSALQGCHPTPIAVTNRSLERAERAAVAVGAGVVPWTRRHEEAARAELVIVATAAPEPVLRKGQMPERRSPDEAPALVVDLARPRNVDPGIGSRPGYVLRDLDALRNRIDRVEEKRRTELPRAEAICDELLSEFVSWVFHQEALQPAVHAIRDTFESIRRQEIERHAHRFDHADQEDLDRLTRSILQKVLAVPIVRLKDADADTIDFTRGIRLLSTLFSRPGCEDEHFGTDRASEESEEKTSGQMPPSDVPARCPFETHALPTPHQQARDCTLVHRALEDPILETM